MKEQHKISEVPASIANKKVTSHQSQLSTLYEQKKTLMLQILTVKKQANVIQVTS
jgi:hypothetical protein